MRRIGVLLPAPRTMRHFSPASGVPASAAATGLERRGVMCGSTIRWAGPMPTAIRSTRRNWRRSRRRHSDQWKRGRGGSCNRQLALYRSCLLPLPTRSARASLIVCRDRAATSPALPSSNMPWREMARVAQRDFAAHDARGGPPRSRAVRARSVRRASRPRRLRLGWKSTRSILRDAERSSVL